MAHTFDTYLQEFLNWLQNEKTCSVNTITAYRKDLEQFGAFLEQEKLSVEDITYRELRFYMASLQRNQELKKTTLSRKTAALKSFFKFSSRSTFSTEKRKAFAIGNHGNRYGFVSG